MIFGGCNLDRRMTFGDCSYDTHQTRMELARDTAQLHACVMEVQMRYDR